MYSQIDVNKRKTVLFIIIFMVFITFLGWVFIRVYPEYGYGPIVIAIIISLIMASVSYFSGDKVALMSTGAKGPLKTTDNPYVYRMVENLCITAGAPMPKIYIIPDNSMNAFATGRDPGHASIALTQGIIDRLKNEELEGVIAHELSHIKNYDIRLMMIVVVLVGIIVILSDWFIRIRWYGGGRRSSGKNSGGQIGVILMLAGVVLLVLSPLIAELIKLAISRKREFLADASGALLTRYPEGLARALEKISAQAIPLKRASNATAHLFISSPFGAKAGTGFKKLFSTHPPIEERVRALRSMA
ncbi:zinc metalloprotease HtpX [Candidatus Kuenenbacteria bacterium CG11_big_fil_rev_8_21_14_0_20_37_9]|uniref:Protease HtpX homolog n=2 Tax=Candidatus Kueneniibacteriota TaxID=1752740 RepID=A0A2M6XTG1_9BACT|nr:MAG: zinc metalloprotease HtpX [Candidatus Kuenenbacteria bacterium CG1_02_38_13]PIR05767.1 MAG: zinc metalloprotease HtpX [Candidatus Kuenenbacteria bacterium CG11_big_fil_rev_8_21_14_0_20_37_9]PIU10861.1 MAG: zinc metalloprotease HtpX [Candidatus Kuenenbacteria bacterium CG08_land_8_20_14_0_20_37_23]